MLSCEENLDCIDFIVNKVRFPVTVLNCDIMICISI